MFKKIWDSWFGSTKSTSNVISPQGFTASNKKRSVFLNRYFGIFYFIVVWHALGYFTFGTIRDKAQSQGKEIQEFLSLDTKRIQRIKINVGEEDDGRPKPPPSSPTSK